MAPTPRARGHRLAGDPQGRRHLPVDTVRAATSGPDECDTRGRATRAGTQRPPRRARACRTRCRSSGPCRGRRRSAPAAAAQPAEARERLLATTSARYRRDRPRAGRSSPGPPHRRRVAAVGRAVRAAAPSSRGLAPWRPTNRGSSRCDPLGRRTTSALTSQCSAAHIGRGPDRHDVGGRALGRQARRRPVGQGIASGMPLGALIARADLLESWGPGAHGSTYGGNPVACAAALATIDLLEGGLVENARIRGDEAFAGLAELRRRHPQLHHRRPRQRPDDRHRVRHARARRGGPVGRVPARAARPRVRQVVASGCRRR